MRLPMNERKLVEVSAKPKKVKKEKRTTLTASVVPCAGRSVNLQVKRKKGWKTIAKV